MKRHAAYPLHARLQRIHWQLKHSQRIRDHGGMAWLDCLWIGGTVTWLLLVGAVLAGWLLGYHAGRHG